MLGVQQNVDIDSYQGMKQLDSWLIFLARHTPIILIIVFILHTH